MKIEVEISDEMIRDALEEAVIKQVRGVLSGWRVDDEVKDQVKKRWPSIVGVMIEERVLNREALKAQISEEIARKLRLQISAAMKAASAKDAEK
jgi:Mor family transcriptional regulator